ncbi:hypothetical protein KR093_000201 [Drosophila rubida]|uniref:Uncharacterized protein n=1 Tax=Drosophila rubida TaxID=30044 RepID=A0AAD4PIG6_9MUSC|nr:hypothetical protein KR093_000201 [Drosophila rubida]
MSAAGFLDAQQSASVAAAKRRRSYGNAARVHGRSSGGGVSAVLYKSFRERFMSLSAGSSSDAGVSDYRVLRQRDAEAARVDDELSSNGSSSDAELSQLSSSSSVEDLFANETERRNWRQKTAPERSRSSRGKRRAGRKVSAHFPFHSLEHIVVEQLLTFKYSDQFSLDQLLALCA